MPMGQINKNPISSGKNNIWGENMSRTREDSVQYVMIQNALSGIDGNKEKNRYKAKCKDFSTWLKQEHGINKPSVAIANAKTLIQDYERKLEDSGKYSASTIHTYLAPICKGLGVNMRDISKPKRTSNTITRGRKEDANPQGRKEITQEKYRPLVAVQRVTGLRRSELAKIRGRDLCQDENGYMCIHTVGKGGKTQLQRILPEDHPVIEKAFKDIKPNQLLFEPDIMKNKINLHGIRADQGYRTYQYYLHRLETEPEYKHQCLRELRDRHIALRPDGHSLQTFLKSCYNSSPYLLRGSNREKAIKTGRPISYNRTALMMVSVFHLSHWRLDVTVTNYILQ